MSRPNRPRAGAANITEFEWAFLCDSAPEDQEHSAQLWSLEADNAVFAVSGRSTSELWRIHGADVLAWWVVERPGRRPRLWWRYDAPGPRVRIGGAGTPCCERLANKPWLEFGVEVIWITDADVRVYEKLGRPLGVPAVALNNPPKFEAQATFLERHGLFLKGERERLTEADFEPERLAVE